MFPQPLTIANPLNSQYSYVSNESSIVERRQEAAKSFQEEINTEEYNYFQSQLCSIMPKVSLEVKKPTRKSSRPRIFGTLNTPFGKSKIEFKYCPTQQRYNRFVCKGGKYKTILEKLDTKYKSCDRKNIYQLILKYLTLLPVHNNLDPWDYSGFESNYQDNILANFCAILAVCDPCFGKGENGGKDIRGVLRSKKCQEGCLFKTFLKPYFYPLSQIGAYKIARNSVKMECIKKIETETLKGINKMTLKHSPIKSKSHAMVSSDKRIKLF